MHAAKYDHVRVGLRGGLRKLQRIRHGVGHFLHFRALVMMGEQNGIVLGAKLPHALLLPANFLGPIGDCLHGGDRVASSRSYLAEFPSLALDSLSECGRIEL